MRVVTMKKKFKRIFYQLLQKLLTKINKMKL